MTTKSNGLLYADYFRAMKAAKKCGAKTVRVDLDGAITFSFDDTGLAAADQAERIAKPIGSWPSKPPPSPAKRANPAWEKWGNDPECLRLRREAEDLNQRMLAMRREPRQPNGRMTTFAQLRETSPEFRRLEEERDKLDRKLPPEPPMFLSEWDGELRW